MTLALHARVEKDAPHCSSIHFSLPASPEKYSAISLLSHNRSAIHEFEEALGAKLEYRTPLVHSCAAHNTASIHLMFPTDLLQFRIHKEDRVEITVSWHGNKT